MNVYSNLPPPEPALEPEWPLVDGSMGGQLVGFARISQRQFAYDREVALAEDVSAQDEVPASLWAPAPAAPPENIQCQALLHGMCFCWEGSLNDIVLRWVEVMREWGAGAPGLPAYYEVPVVAILPSGALEGGPPDNPQREVVRLMFQLDLSLNVAVVGNWRWSLDDAPVDRAKVLESRTSNPKKGKGVSV